MVRAALLAFLALAFFPALSSAQPLSSPSHGLDRFQVMPFVGYAYVPTARGLLVLSEDSREMGPVHFGSSTRHVVPVGATLEYRLTGTLALTGAAAYARRGDGSMVLGSTFRVRLEHEGNDFIQVPRGGGGLWMARAGLTLGPPGFPLRLTVGPALLREVPGTRTDPGEFWSDEVVNKVNRAVTHPAVHLGADVTLRNLLRPGLDLRLGLDGQRIFWNGERLAEQGLAPFQEWFPETEGRLRASSPPLLSFRVGVAYRP